MSAFTVTHETLNCVVHALYSENLPSEQMDELGQKLWQMNQSAVNTRYKVSVPLFQKYRWTPRHYSDMQKLKSLHCFIYQCAEGDIPECDLYKLVSRKANDLAYEIVSHLPEWNEAKWDLPNR